MDNKTPPDGDGANRASGRPRAETVLDLKRLMVRLTDLGDFDLRSAQAMALRFIRNPAHLHNGVAREALVQIEDEMRRRADKLQEQL